MEETSRSLGIPSHLKRKIETGLKKWHHNKNHNFRLHKWNNGYKISLKLQALKCKALIIDFYFYISWNSLFSTLCWCEIY